MAKRGKSDRIPQTAASADTANSLPENAAGLSSVRGLEVAVKSTFGVSSLRDDQAEVIRAGLGTQNILVNKPTGWGKSLCYQAPAVIEHAQSGKLTIVVSPLLALIREQSLRLLSQNVRVAYLDSLMSHEDFAAQSELVKSQQTALVYISPERFRTAGFKQLIQDRTIARVVVDEAHCVSMWGHDFRPSYLEIPKICKEIGNPPLSLFTATAPVIVRDDIIATMGLGEGEYLPFTANPDRPNLQFERKEIYSTKEKLDILIKLLQQASAGHQTTIVYFNRKADLEEVAEMLPVLGIKALRYHASMEQDERQKNQDVFMRGKWPIMFATSAFGMGIDRRDVRNVIHFAPPKSLEDYYQEAGRAGRDGKAAVCTLLYTPRDLYRSQLRLEYANPELESIRSLYQRLWRGSKHQSDGTTDTYFNLEKHLLDTDQRNPLRQDLTRAAFAILQEYGLIAVHGHRVRFLQAAEVSDAKEHFPISTHLLDQKRTRDIVRLAVMTHYAREKEQDPRQILMDHFMYNTVAHEATRTRSFGSQMLDQRFIDFTLLQLREKDCDVGDLSRDFRAAAHASNSPFPELSVLTPQEVRADLEQLASLGYARILKVGDNTYATLDTKGEARLQELGAPVVPCSTWKELSKRLYSRSSKQILKEALEDWFSMERNNRRENQWWAAIDYFLDRKFHLFREDVKGNEIVEQYFRRKYTRQKGINPIKRHAREFLNYVFDDQIELSLRP